MNAILEQRKAQVITEISGLENARVLESIERLLAWFRSKTEESLITEEEISNLEIRQLLDESRPFEFLQHEDEDIYSDSDLKVRY